jgi:hypothetical protein
MRSGMSPDAAITAAWNEVGYERTLEDWMVSGVKNAMGLGADLGPASLLVKKSNLLGGFYDKEGLTLSKRLWGAGRLIKETVSGEVRAAMIKGKGWATRAQELHAILQTGGDPTKKIAEVAAAARRALAGDNEAIKQFTSKLNQVKKYAEQLAANGAPTRHLKVQYQESLAKMMKAVETGKAELIDKALDRAIWEKARYNTERLVRTEAARAYGDGFKVRLYEDEDVVGYRSVLSSRHDIDDICNFYAEADLYGLGPGIFPKEEGPPYPYHPHCLCGLLPVYYGEIDKSLVDDGATHYLDSLSDDERQAMMGKAGAEKYAENPGAWRDTLRGWQPNESKAPSAELLASMK